MIEDLIFEYFMTEYECKSKKTTTINHNISSCYYKRNNCYLNLIKFIIILL